MDAALARSIWRYDPETGHFFWLISPKYDVMVGDRAGCFDGRYWRLAYKQKSYKASRVAWLFQTENWPNDQIDHRDGNRLNDAFVNLREASNVQNCCNRSRKVRQSRYGKGVYFQGGQFRVRVYFRGEITYLGPYDTNEKAKIAYAIAAKRIHGEFARA